MNTEGRRLAWGPTEVAGLEAAFKWRGFAGESGMAKLKKNAAAAAQSR